MKQKAQIDIIDISIPDSDLGPGPEDKDSSPAPPDSPSPGRRRKKLLWLAGGIVLAVVVIVAVWYLAGEWQDAGSKKEQQAAVPAPSLDFDRLPLSDFFIEVRDGQGKARILQCSVVLDIDRTRHQDLSNRQLEIRKTIYRILGSRSVAVLLGPEEKKIIKKDIHEELNGLFGKGAVKEVYFEKYIIL
jgi:flagellar basal body-associated protein FliL